VTQGRLTGARPPWPTGRGWWVAGSVAGLVHIAALLVMTAMTPVRRPTPPVVTLPTVAVEMVTRPEGSGDRAPTLVPTPRPIPRGAAGLTPGASVVSRRPLHRRRSVIADDVPPGLRVPIALTGPIAPTAPTPRSGASDADLSRPFTHPDATGAGVTVALAAPRYLHHPPPPYPRDCLRRHQEGVALLIVVVGVDGRAVSVSLRQSSGHSLLDQAAIAAVWQWVFEPARRDGKSVASQVLVPVRFAMTPR
jgi:TonB family protein